jgi:hypothetical protein
MRMIAYLLSGILCALLASSIASAQDKCAPLINDAAKYQTCRMNEVGRNIREREKGTRDDPAIGLTYPYRELVNLFNKGKPLVCNSTKTKYGEHLQCWYPDRALNNQAPTMYFDNRELTATQR